MDNVSKYISYKEATNSETAKRRGISNIPTQAQLENMKLVGVNVFDKIREHFNTPIFVSSMFRSEELNKAIGGSKTSQHCANNGAAIDIDADRYGMVTNKEIFSYILNNLEFDQLIWEFGNEDNPAWVHVSYKEKYNRNQILIAFKDESGKTKYKEYINFK